MVNRNSPSARCRLATLLVVLLTTCIIQTTRSQSFRSLEDYYFNIGTENILDTRILPDNEDVTIFLYRREPQSYFFPIKKQDIPVSITVTPCSSPIEWKVFFHSEEPDKQDDEFFLQREGLKKTPSERKTSFLHAFEGHDMSTYTTHGHYPKGLLRITFLAKDENAKVRVLTVCSSQPELAFPILPKMAAVEVVANDKMAVTVSWKPSPSHVLLGQRVEYCVSFNPRKNYRTLCELQTDRDGDALPSWNRNAGFGFAWEGSSRSRVLHLRRTLLSKVKPRRDVHLECVGERHWATVTSLLPRKLYYVDVFAVNEFTNRSVAYFGTSLVTQTGVETAEPIRAGVVYAIKVGGSRASHQHSFSYELKTRAKKVNLFLQTCSGHDDIGVDVTYEGATIASAKQIGAFHKIALKSAEIGGYSIRVTAMSRDESREVKLCVSSRSKKCPYNSVPNNRTVTMATNSHKSPCAPPTFHWLAADRHANYCLYRYDTGTGNNYDAREHATGVAAPLCDSCCGMRPLSEQLKKEDLLFCHRQSRRSFEKSGNYVNRIVELPSSRTNYTVLLQVNLRQNVTVSYNPIRIETQNNRQQCN